MGFYSPEVIVGDAKRHGVKVLPVDINLSQGKCTVEKDRIRLGFGYVKDMGEEAIVNVKKARGEHAFVSLADFYQRAKVRREAIDSLILAGAMDSFGSRRQMLWDIGIVEQTSRDALLFECPGYQVPLPNMTDWEKLAAEYSVQGLSAETHPMKLIRDGLPKEGIIKNSSVLSVASGSRISVAGYVVCRQTPRTAKGHVFLTVEDETGLVNVILRPDVYKKFRYSVITEPLIMVDGVFQRRDAIANLVAEQITPLKRNGADATPKARNFC